MEAFWISATQVFWWILLVVSLIVFVVMSIFLIVMTIYLHDKEKLSETK